MQIAAFDECPDGPGRDVQKLGGFLGGDEEGRGCARRIGRGRKEGHATMIARKGKVLRAFFLPGAIFFVDNRGEGR